MKSVDKVIGLIASLLTIFNFTLAIPSVFKNIDSIALLEITERNFTLKLGFVLILEFGFGYIFTILLRSSQNTYNSFNAHSGGVLISLCSAWLTFFNITEILYSGRYLNSTSQLWGMFFFIFCSLVIQGSMIIYADSNESVFDKWKFSKGSWVMIIAVIETIFFLVYAFTNME